MEKICKKCKKVFNASNKRKIYCDTCKKIVAKENKQRSDKHQQEKRNRKKKKKTVDTLVESNREVVEYNKKHGTNLSYGKYYGLKRIGKL